MAHGDTQEEATKIHLLMLKENDDRLSQPLTLQNREIAQVFFQYLSYFVSNILLKKRSHKPIFLQLLRDRF